jgi:hypothetical protein
MFSLITNIYNKKTKGPTLMELFTATGKWKRFPVAVQFSCLPRHMLKITALFRINLLFISDFLENV